LDKITECDKGEDLSAEKTENIRMFGEELRCIGFEDV